MVHHHYWSVPTGCIGADNWSYMTNKSCLCGAITNSDGKLEYSFMGEKSAGSTISGVASNVWSCDEIDRKLVKLWDSLPLSSSVLQNAVLTANMLLGVHSYIQNTN